MELGISGKSKEIALRVMTGNRNLLLIFIFFLF